MFFSSSWRSLQNSNATIIISAYLDSHWIIQNHVEVSTNMILDTKSNVLSHVKELILSLKLTLT